MNLLRRIKIKLWKGGEKTVYVVYSLLRPNQKTIWLIGSGRSGTTWIMNLINYSDQFVEIFEPFHERNKSLFMKFMIKRGYRNNLYRLNSSIGAIVKMLLNNGLPCINLHKLVFSRPRITLVKDIYANLFSHQACAGSSKIKPILLLRNPFAVAVSKVKSHKLWLWYLDLTDIFLSEGANEFEFLTQYRALSIDIFSKGTLFEKAILNWCILNYVPIKQFSEGELLITFYEDWVMYPDDELNRVYEYCEIPHQHIANFKKTPKFVQPSFVSEHKFFDINGWQEQISKREYEAGIKILSAFGFDKLYDECSIPNKAVIKKIRNGTAG